MADCSCTHTPTPGSLSTTTDLVTYDGAATCTGFTTGDVNDWITHISDLLCALQTTVSGLSYNAEDIGLTGITGTTCVPTAGTADLGEWLSDVESFLCTLNTTVHNLLISDIGGTFSLACLNPSLIGLDLEETLSFLRQYLCDVISGAYLRPLLVTGGQFQIPLYPYTKDALVITDVSATGVAKVNLDATAYWINAVNLSMVSTNVNLIDSSDNYIFIDIDTDAYTVNSVAIGAASPTTNGDKICKVQTGVGTVASYVTLIKSTPITTELLPNDISAANISTSIGTAPIQNDGSNLKLNYNTTNFDVIGSDLIIKDGGVNTAAKINTAVYNGSLEIGSSGKWQLAVNNSIELNAVTDKVQLVNDSSTPGNSYYYGTNSSGTKGYHSLPTNVELLETDWIKCSNSAILQLHSSPFTLIAAPGADNYVIIDHIELFNDHGGVDYVSNTLEFRYTNSAGVKVTEDVTQAFMQSSVDAFYHSISASGVTTKNAPIIAYVPTADPTTGTGDLYIKAFYKIINP